MINITKENALNGAKFTITSQENDFKYTTTIDEKLVLPNIPSGIYNYKIEKKGYKKIEDTIIMGEHSHITLPITLEKTKTRKNTKKA